MQLTWGEQLQAFRMGAGYETLSQFAEALDEIGLHLDITTLSRYESNARRIPKQRERHLKLLEGLAVQGGVETVAQANDWLRLGAMGHLTVDEEQRLFPTAVSPQPSPPQPSTTPPPPRVNKRWLLTAVFALIILFLISAGTLSTKTRAPEGAVVPENRAVVAQTAVATVLENPLAYLQNGGFESTEPSPWYAATDCPLAFTADESRAAAYEGERYLAAATDNADCYSFHQDIALKDVLTDTLTFSVRARSADGSPRPVTLALWTGTGDGQTFTWNETDNQAQQFLIGGEAWHCLETTLQVSHDWQEWLRAEIYLDKQDGAAYHFDDAWLQAGGGGVCPPPAAEMRNGGFEDISIFPWVSVEDCQVAALLPSAQAREGKQMATAVTQDPTCRSFFQDIAQTPEIGDTYTYSMWAKSASGLPLSGEIVLWAEGGTQEKAAAPFVIFGSEWQCLEVQMPIAQEGHDRLRAEMYLGTVDGSSYYFDDAALRLQTESSCPPRRDLLANKSFEDISLFPWQNFDCNQLQISKDGLALDGENYLLAQKQAGENCHSFYQDIPMLMSPGDVYRFSMWVRSTDEQPQAGEIVLWAEGGEKEKSGTSFVVAGEEWQCVETELTIAHDNHTLLRSEIYLSQEGVDYYFDKASVDQNGESSCPEVDLFLGNLLTADTGPFYAGSSVFVEAEVRNGGETAVSPHTTAIWVAHEENGNPIDPARQKLVSLVDLLAPKSSRSIDANIAIPLHLEPGNYFLVFEADNAQNLLETNEQNNRYSIPFDISPYAQGTLFCDVALDHWARPEMELWYEIGMTKGCHSEGVAYENLPFCPNAPLNRATFAVFLLRHMQGANFRPEAPYAGLFADVSPDTSFATWIEELDRLGIALDSAACSPANDGKNYCPDAYVTKGDLAQYLAQLLAWPLPDEADGQFSDVAGDGLQARAITYMDQQGYLAQQDYLVANGDSCVGTQGRGFCPDQRLTRAEAAVMMVRAFGLQQIEP